MFESAIDLIFTILLTLGISVLFIIFVFKGAFVGKFMPTTVFLPGYVLAVNASLHHTVGIIAVTAIGYVVGQLIIYIGLRKHGVEILRKIPYITLPDDRIEQSNMYFERYGGITIFVSNLIPGVRGIQLIPAAASAYPSEKVIAYSLAATFIYHAAIVYVVVGSFNYLL